jgi:hypothetical protein
VKDQAPKHQLLTDTNGQVQRAKPDQAENQRYWPVQGQRSPVYLRYQACLPVHTPAEYSAEQQYSKQPFVKN